MARYRTDAEKKKIIADYLESGNYSAAARANGVSVNTVRQYVRDNPETAKLLNKKKEENTKTILEYMESKAKSVQYFCDYVLDERLNPAVNREELDKLSLPNLSTVFGVIVDKFLKVRELTPPQAKTETNNLLEAVEESVKELVKADDLSEI